MASPITHIVLALKILCLLPGTVDKQAFIVGTSFPDIRYAAGLSRELTHIEPVSWHDVVNEPSSFRAGMMFHNLVDILRMKHFEPYFYDRFDKSHSRIYVTYFPLVMKMAEDAVLHPVVHEWSDVYNYFDEIYEEELALCPDEAILCKWHHLIQDYCLDPPSLESIDAFVSGVGGLTLYTSPPEFNCINYFNELVGNKTFQEKTLNFYDNFEALLSDEKLTTPR